MPDLYECPLCEWFVEALIVICDPAPGCTSAETFEVHQEQLRHLLAQSAREKLVQHLRDEHSDWADLSLPL